MNDPRRPSGRVVALVGLRGLFASRLLPLLLPHPAIHRILALDVEPLHRTPFSLPSHPKVSLYRLDFTEAHADVQIASIFRSEQVDTVVHLACLEQPSRDLTWAHEYQSIGTLHLLNACSALRISTLILRSSSLVYGSHPSHPASLEESHPLDTSRKNEFIRDKVDTETQVLSFQRWNPRTTVTILRFAPILSPKSHDFLVSFLSSRVAWGLLGRDTLLQCLHEEDAIRAMELALFHDTPGVFNIAPHGVISLRDLLHQAGCIRLPVPLSLARSLARLLWVSEIQPFPPSFVDLLRFPCLASNRLASHRLSFNPRFTTEDTVRLFCQERRLLQRPQDAHQDG